MKLFTIRHGAYEDKFDSQGRKLIHTPDSALDTLGRLQTYQLCKIFKIRGITFDAIYTSPYRRAKEMAGLAARSLNIHKVSEIDGLKDVFPNSANGKPWEDLEKIGGDIYAYPLDDDPQESLNQLVDRSRRTIRDIIAEVREKNFQSIAYVSHGDTISAIDWALRNSENPTFYGEMKRAFYLQKAEAFGYTLDASMRLSAEGKIITLEAAKESIEGFRGFRNSKEM